MKFFLIGVNRKCGTVIRLFWHLHDPSDWVFCDSPRLEHDGGEPSTNVLGKLMTNDREKPFLRFDHDSNVAAMSRSPLVIS
jgi:hypothetical protein